MVEHTVELSQVGSKGTVLFETSFGLHFTADYLVSAKVVRTAYGSRRVGVDRTRVIKPLSPCCGFAYTHYNDNAKAPLTCHKCRTAPPWPGELLDFTLPNMYEFALPHLEALVGYFILDVLEASLVASGLWAAIQEVFSDIAAGKRTRTVVKLRPSSDV